MVQGDKQLRQTYQAGIRQRRVRWRTQAVVENQEYLEDSRTKGWDVMYKEKVKLATEVFRGQQHHLSRCVDRSQNPSPVSCSLGAGRAPKQHLMSSSPDLAAALQEGLGRSDVDLLLQDWEQWQLVTVVALEWRERPEEEQGRCCGRIDPDEVSAP